MKSIRNISDIPISNTLLADQILEFHASRLILLIHLCGKSDRIDGLTKLAKLDFFVRYPEFFQVAQEKLGIPVNTHLHYYESSMIRFHYGPWDDRYYHVLSYLEGKKLLNINQQGNMFGFELTKTGKEIAIILKDEPDFSTLIEQMKEVKKAFGNKAGSTLKRLIYQLFDDEVAKRTIGEVIR